MTALSTAAWTAHDIGLATAIGGTLYGRAALEPALDDVAPEERDRISNDAWQRFSWLNLAAHGVIAATWFVGRSMLSGREAGGFARGLTRIKDGLVVASLATGVGSMIVGRELGKRAKGGDDDRSSAVRESVHSTSQTTSVTKLRRSVRVLGIANLIANIAIMGITTVLAMEGNQSARFAARSRFLP